MAIIPSIMKAPETKEQGWLNEFSYLEAQRQAYKEAVRVLDESSISNRELLLNQTRIGLLNIEYEMNRFILDTPDNLVAQAEEKQQFLNTQTILTPDQELAVQQDIDALYRDASILVVYGQQSHG